MLSAALYDTKPYDRQYFEIATVGQAVRWHFQDFRLSIDTVASAAGQQAICAFVNDRLDAPCLKALSDLGVRMVALRCAGFNNVDLNAARAHGIRVVRVPSYSPHAVAEHALGLLLTLNRKIHRAYNRVREHNFSLSGLVGFDVHGKTVGIVGTGKIGRVAAELFHGLTPHVVAYDPVPSPEWAAEKGIRYAPFEEVLATSDILSLHLPLSANTFHLLDATTIAKTKPGVFIVNTSRGKLIDTRAVIEALKTGHLGGVALDVYEEEEGVFFEDLSGQVLLDDELSRLLGFPNVLITSHQAFLTKEALGEIARVTVENLSRFARQMEFLPGTALA